MWSDTPVYEVGGEVVFGLLKDSVVPDASDELYVVPTAGAGRLDLISDHVYGTPELWWVIARVNNIADPFIGPSTAQELRIPTRARLVNLGLLQV